MKHFFPLVFFLLPSLSQAVVYEPHEISAINQDLALQEINQTYIHDYFTAAKPQQVINQLMTANLSPLEREYILFQLLTEISLQPPQEFHHDLLNRMKEYKNEAHMAANEGHNFVTVFNINSKAYGIENIWTAYRTEQNLNQLFAQDIPQAVSTIGQIIKQPINARRPQWLGAKNSMAALSHEQNQVLTQYLGTQVKANSGYDLLISHVALKLADRSLINKALQSELKSIREFTLRQLSASLGHSEAASLLLEHAKNGPDKVFSTSLLGQHLQHEPVQLHLLNSIKEPKHAQVAAYALSQTTDSQLLESISKQYLESNNEQEKNHLLYALRLNPSEGAKLTLNRLKQQIDPNSQASQWLRSFEGGQQ